MRRTVLATMLAAALVAGPAWATPSTDAEPPTTLSELAGRLDDPPWRAPRGDPPARSTYDKKAIAGPILSADGSLGIEQTYVVTLEHRLFFTAYFEPAPAPDLPVWFHDDSVILIAFDVNGDPYPDYFGVWFRHPVADWMGGLVDAWTDEVLCRVLPGVHTDGPNRVSFTAVIPSNCWPTYPRFRWYLGMQVGGDEGPRHVLLPHSTWGPWTYIETMPGRMSPEHAEGFGVAGHLGFTEAEVANMRRPGQPVPIAAPVLNVTAVSPTWDGYLNVYPCRAREPLTSSVSYHMGQTRPNLVIAPFPLDDATCVRTTAYSHVVVDVFGWFRRGEGFTSLDTVRRVLDTRQTGGRLQPGEVRPFTLPAGAGGVPVDANAVSFNLTATGGAGSGYVTVFPCGASPPLTSSVNFTRGRAVANAVIAPLDTDQRICLTSPTAVHVVIDLNGWFDDRTFRPLPPRRALDTRTGVGAPALRTNGTSVRLPVTGQHGIPASGATAVAMNVTALGAPSGTYVTVHACGGVPPVSNLNVSRGQIVANAVIANLSAGGEVCFTSPHHVHLVADITGWFPDGGGYVPVTPRRIFDSRGDGGISPWYSG